MPGRFRRDDPEKPVIPPPGRQPPKPDDWIRKIDPNDDVADEPPIPDNTEDSGDEITNYPPPRENQ